MTQEAPTPALPAPLTSRGGHIWGTAGAARPVTTMPPELPSVSGVTKIRHTHLPNVKLTRLIENAVQPQQSMVNPMTRAYTDTEPWAVLHVGPAGGGGHTILVHQHTAEFLCLLRPLHRAVSSAGCRQTPAISPWASSSGFSPTRCSQLGAFAGEDKASRVSRSLTYLGERLPSFCLFSSALPPSAG